ncbi:nucleotide exchange factor GrpE [Alkalibacillus haloalkaliphilus]|uniref:nucleotide exchange factor GrpE n=1 Tax=Alkalibacillus haloalkaliphilus TaxID=94136 RepID=UPI0029356930|nr:nucleotide exchange factor GrpE [Alkalibacillus haloalkaliphilus]MDV2581038.1 nucleotide exchange factor GrpE [Alkalibacillus haloalkaliphilus]
MNEQNKGHEDLTEEVVNDENIENQESDSVIDETVEQQADEVEGNEAEQLSEIEEVKQEKEALQDKLARLQADFDNFRRRTKKEKEADLKYKSQDIANDLIPVLDNFERALQVEVNDESTNSFAEGLEMVYNQFRQALEQHGIEEVEAEGVQFDPQKHQAVMQVSEEGYESNQVIEVLQKGYQLKDRVIRPAMVKVNE